MGTRDWRGATIAQQRLLAGGQRDQRGAYETTVRDESRFLARLNYEQNRIVVCRAGCAGSGYGQRSGGGFSLGKVLVRACQQRARIRFGGDLFPRTGRGTDP